jgi:hypothetical protein
MGLVLIVLLVVWVLEILTNFIFFDLLVRHLYQNNRAGWQQAGCPSGFFWRPPAGTDASDRASGALHSLLWLFKAPQFVVEDSKSRNLLRVLRIKIAFGNLLLVAVLGLTYYYFAVYSPQNYGIRH